MKQKSPNISKKTHLALHLKEMKNKISIQKDIKNTKKMQKKIENYDKNKIIVAYFTFLQRTVQ